VPYFFAPEPAPGFAEVDAWAGFGFSAFGFLASRLDLFCPFAMIASWVSGCLKSVSAACP
jgi:hypothetical protein